jgi:hypothetical protein
MHAAPCHSSEGFGTASEEYLRGWPASSVGCYVPNSLSPKSPRPGRMYLWVFNPRSRAAV